MKKQITLVSLIVVFSAVYGQDYIPYWNLRNGADSAMYHKDYDVALGKLGQAIGSVPYVHSDTYRKAAICAVKEKQLENGYGFIKLAIQGGTLPHFWQHGDVKKALASSAFYASMEDSADIWHQQHLASIHMEYRALVDSMYYIDQRILRNNLTVKGDYQVDKDLGKSDQNVDSMLFHTLLGAIEKWGFPSEEIIGREGNQKASIIIHHNVRLPENHGYFPLFEKALKEGAYLPKDYAWAYDQGRMWIEEEPVFYYGVAPPLVITEEKIMEIDQARRKYGIKPFSSTKVMKRGKATKTVFLW
ncbi:MAG: hypothetical protein AAGI38_14590 [Bacteroidota bacterium]